MTKTLPTLADNDERVKSALTEAAGHYRAGRYVEAERVCRNFLKHQGSNAHLFNTLGAALRSQGRQADAVKAYRASIKVIPDNAAAWSNLSNALSDMEQFEEAIEAGRKALELAPTNATYQDNLAKVERRQYRAQPRTSRPSAPRQRARSARPGKRRPKILFVSHEASRTGAPILLLTFLRWLKANADVDFEILVKGHSDWRVDKKEQLELVPDFEALAPTAIWYRRGASRIDLQHMEQLKDQIVGGDFDLVFSNTICNGELLDPLAQVVDCPMMTYVHELEFSIRCNPPRHVASVMKHTNYFVAGSRIVKQNLVESHGIIADDIGVVPSFIDIVNHRPEHAPAVIRAQLGIPADASVVNACATIEWRKGTELFVLLANAVRRKLKKPVHFVWVGSSINQDLFTVRYDVSRMGLEDRVHFIGSKSNFRDYIAAADLFTLMSREDPFPLVALEAALLQRPILCFDKGGGTGEFVEKDCGFVVPYLDIEAMAERVVELLKKPALRDSLGKRAATKVRERHDAAVGSAQLWKLIDKALAPERIAV